MLLALLAVAAVVQAEPAAATGATEVSPVTVAAPVAPEAKEKPRVVCVNERPTGSRRIQRVCYDRLARETPQERVSGAHVTRGPAAPGGGLGGSPR